MLNLKKNSLNSSNCIKFLSLFLMNSFAIWSKESCVFAGSLNEEIITIVANRAFGPDVKVQNFTINGYSLDRVGYMGDHGSLEIFAKSKSTNDAVQMKKFFVKMAYLNNSQAHEYTKESFICEMNVYSQLLPAMQDLVKCPTFSSKFFYASPDIIILEDNRVNGYQTRFPSIVLDSEDLKAGARAIARLHASARVSSKKLGKPLNFIYPDSFSVNNFIKFEKRNMHELVIDLVSNLTQKFNISRNIITAGVDKIGKYLKQEIGDHHVVCHGDAWSNNLMFDQSNPPNCILVDFAGMSWGDQVVDLLQFLYLSTSRQTRELHEKEVLTAYHEEFRQIIIDNECEIKIRNATKLLQEYEENRGIGKLYALYYAPMKVGMDIINKYTNGVDALETFIFRKDNTVIFELMENNSAYKNMLTEHAEEFVESII